MSIKQVPVILSRILLYHNKVDIKPDPSNPTGPWKVDRLIVKPTEMATWKCDDCTIVMSFPKGRTPLEGGATEASGKNRVEAPIDANAKGYYPYSILVVDGNNQVHSVEGNSPPEMIVE